MEGIGDHAPLRAFLHVQKIVDPVLEHEPVIHEPGQDPFFRAHELEVRIIVERPADRHFDEFRRFAEHRRLFQLDHVALTHAIRHVVVAHHAGVVGEAVLDEELHRIRAQVPARRAVAARIFAGNALDRFIAANEFLFFLLAREFHRRNVPPAVMADFMAGIDHRLHQHRWTDCRGGTQPVEWPTALQPLDKGSSCSGDKPTKIFDDLHSFLK